MSPLGTGADQPGAHTAASSVAAVQASQPASLGARRRHPSCPEWPQGGSGARLFPPLGWSCEDASDASQHAALLSTSGYCRSCPYSCHRGASTIPDAARPIQTSTSLSYPKIPSMSQSVSPSSCLPSISASTEEDRRRWTLLLPPHHPPDALPRPQPGPPFLLLFISSRFHTPAPSKRRSYSSLALFCHC